MKRLGDLIEVVVGRSLSAFFTVALSFSVLLLWIFSVLLTWLCLKTGNTGAGGGPW